MTLEGRLRQMVTALPNEASVTLPVSVVRGWLDEEGDDSLDDYTVADVAAKLNRSEGTVRSWICSGEFEAYWLGREYRITLTGLAAYRDRRERAKPRGLSSSPEAAVELPHPPCVVLPGGEINRCRP